VTVSSTASGSTRTSATSVVVSNIDADVPSVKLIASKGATAVNYDKVNFRNRLDLTGFIEVPAGVSSSVEWSMTGTKGVSTLTDLNPVAGGSAITVGPTAGLPFNLAIAGGRLQSGNTYIFKCTAKNAANGKSSSATQTVIVNDSPRPGSIVITPTTGTEMSTLFKVEARFFADGDLPLAYKPIYHKFFPGEELKTENQVEIAATSTVSEFSGVTLPVGSSENNFQRAISLYVFDSFGAYYYISGSVVVAKLPEASRIDSLETEINRILLPFVDVATISPGDSADNKNYINSVSEALNNVNCTIPSYLKWQYGHDFTCENNLNRQSCQYGANTCGPCLESTATTKYIGESGSANTKCYAVTSSNPLPTTGVELKAKCDTTVFNADGSPNPCNGRGSCYIERPAAANGQTSTLYDSAEQPCYVSNPDSICYTQCVCSEDYRGNSCQMTAAQETQLQGMRGTITTVFIKSSAYNDLSVASLTATFQTLITIASAFPDELTDAVKAQVVNYAYSVLLTIGTLDVPSSLLNMVLEVYATCLPSNFDTAQYAAATAIVQAASANDLIAGMASLQAVFDTISSTTSAPETGGASSSPFTQTVAQSASEIEAGVAASGYEVTIEADQTIVASDGTLNEAKFSFLSSDGSTIGQAQNASVLSNALQILVKNMECTAANPVINMTLTVQNAIPKIYFNESRQLSFTCKATGVTQELQQELTSPSGSKKTYVHTCDGLNDEEQVVTLDLVEQPSCIPDLFKYVANSDGTASNTLSQACRVISYTNLTTICECEFCNKATTGRRMLSSMPQWHFDKYGNVVVKRHLQSALADSGALEVGAVAVTAFQNLATSQLEFPALDASVFRETIWITLFIIMMWVVPYLSALLGTLYRRKIDEEADASAHDSTDGEGTLSIHRLHEKAGADTDALDRVDVTAITFLDTMFPDVFKLEHSTPLQYAWKVLKERHAFLSLFLAENMTNAQKFSQSFAFSTVLLGQFFAVAILCEIALPSDDGTCAAQTSQYRCQVLASPFESGAKRCNYDSTTGACTYQDVKVTFKLYLAVIILTVLVTAPVQLFFIWFFDFFANAPTVTAPKDTPVVTATLYRAVDYVLPGGGTAQVNAFNTRENFNFVRQVKDDTTYHRNATISKLAHVESSKDLLEKAYQADVQGKRALAAGYATRRAQSIADARHVLSDRVLEFRTTVADSELEVFDEAWCIKDDPTSLYENNQEEQEERPENFDDDEGEDGEGEDDEDEDDGGHGVRLGRRRTLKRVLRETHQQAHKVMNFMQKNDFADEEIGFEIINQFVVDLIGRNTDTATIFINASDGQFNRAMVFSQWGKLGLVLGVVGINVWFYLSIINLAGTKNNTWIQNVLLLGMWMVVLEVVLVQTSEAISCYYYLPMLRRDEICRAIDNVRSHAAQIFATSSIASVKNPGIDSSGDSSPGAEQGMSIISTRLESVLNREKDPESSESELFAAFSASQFMFVSYVLAELFPHLVESQIVLTYVDPLPPPHWNETFGTRFKRACFILSHPALWVGTLPVMIQRLFVETIVPGVFGLIIFIVATIPVLSAAMDEKWVGGLVVIIISLLVLCFVFRLKFVARGFVDEDDETVVMDESPTADITLTQAQEKYAANIALTQAREKQRKESEAEVDDIDIAMT
jgi:hypothetical protein